MSDPTPPSRLEPVEEPTTNHWSLYQQDPGWGPAIRRLDRALVLELAYLDRMVASGVPISLAADQSFKNMVKVMSQPRNEKYGATDSEPMSYLARAIARHLREVHNKLYYVDRFGCITEA